METGKPCQFGFIYPYISPSFLGQQQLDIFFCDVYDVDFIYCALYVIDYLSYHLGAVAEDWKLLEFETWSRPFDFRSRDMTDCLNYV